MTSLFKLIVQEKDPKNQEQERRPCADMSSAPYIIPIMVCHIQKKVPFSVIPSIPNSFVVVQKQNSPVWMGIVPTSPAKCRSHSSDTPGAAALDDGTKLAARRPALLRRRDHVLLLSRPLVNIQLEGLPACAVVLAQRILLPHKWAILETLTKSPNTKIAMRKFPSRPVVAVSLVRSAKVRSLRPGHSYNACSRLRGRLAKTARLMTMSLWRRIERWTSGKRSSSNSSTSSW